MAVGLPGGNISIRPTLTPLLLSPAKLYRGPFWSLTAYFAWPGICARWRGVLKPDTTMAFIRKCHMKDFSFRLSEQQDQRSEINRPPWVLQSIKYICNKLASKLLYFGKNIVLKYMFSWKAFVQFTPSSIFDNASLITCWVWPEQEFLSVKCDFICDCQFFSFLIEIFSLEISNWRRCQYANHHHNDNIYRRSPETRK